MNSIIYFEIQSSNPEREIKFYQDVFGWKFKRQACRLSIGKLKPPVCMAAC